MNTASGREVLEATVASLFDHDELEGLDSVEAAGVIVAAILPSTGTPEPSQAASEAQVERACEVMHDAYEAAAAGNGWETQAASRKPWADVPEANKATMRAAAHDGWVYLDDPPQPERRRPATVPELAAHQASCPECRDPWFANEVCCACTSAAVATVIDGPFRKPVCPAHARLYAVVGYVIEEAANPHG